ncbi:MAG: hypothetical protein E7507_01320 [Ruminococcus sp.]|nr:hypothetical protein [Ruminococcus sp.]
MNKLFKRLSAVVVAIVSSLVLSLSVCAEIERETISDNQIRTEIYGADYTAFGLETYMLNRPYCVLYFANRNENQDVGKVYYNNSIYPPTATIKDVVWIDDNDHSKGQKYFTIEFDGSYAQITDYKPISKIVINENLSRADNISVHNPDDNAQYSYPTYINWDYIDPGVLQDGDVLVYHDDLTNSVLHVQYSGGVYGIHGGESANRNRKLCSNCGTSSEDNPDLQFIKQGEETYCLPCYQELFGAEFEFNPDDLMNEFDYNFKGIPDINDYAMDFNTGFDWLDTLLASLSQMLLFPFYIVNYLLATLTNMVAVLTNIIALFSSFLTGDLVNAMQLWFAFIPSEIWTIIALGLSILVLLRVVGR